MRALQYFSPEIPLQLRQISDPLASDDEKTFKVVASALNHRDVYICQGLYPGVKPDITLGSDGVVDLEGRLYLINPNQNWGNDQNLPGSDYSILGMPGHGTFADKISILRERLMEMPAHLTTFQGAALPLAGLTAYRLLFSRCNLQSTDRVCISGIGGGVALIALQFALAIGAEVWVTSGSPDKVHRAVELGASGGQLYTEDLWHKKLLKKSGSFDVIIDSAGGGGFAQLVSIANKGARIGIYGGSKGKIENLSPQIIFWKHLNIFGSSMGSDQDFVKMVHFVDQYKIVPVVDSVFKLSEFELAFERMNQGAQFGKIVFDHEI